MKSESNGRYPARPARNWDWPSNREQENFAALQLPSSMAGCMIESRSACRAPAVPGGVSLPVSMVMNGLRARPKSVSLTIEPRCVAVVAILGTETMTKTVSLTAIYRPVAVVTILATETVTKSALTTVVSRPLAVVAILGTVTITKSVSMTTVSLIIALWPIAVVAMLVTIIRVPLGVMAMAQNDLEQLRKIRCLCWSVQECQHTIGGDSQCDSFHV